MGTTKDKVRQVFQFLAEFQKLRTPPARRLTTEWVQFLADLPKDPCISIGSRDGHKSGDDGGASNGNSIVLRVRRPKETACPAVPSNLRDWVQPGWQNIDAEPSYVEARNRETHDGVTTEQFNDD